MNREIAADYIRENFEPTDRLAVVLLNKRTNSVIQRVASAETMAAPDFQAWLKEHNARRCEVYISMNALHPSALGRTKRDVASIRHVYLDFDVNGTAAVESLLKREDVPKPNYLISSSPGKWQVVWKVEGFAKEPAELLQRGLARSAGGDPAATDCSRVLRLPGFYNHKYGKPHLVRVEAMAGETYRPEHFPDVTAEGHHVGHRLPENHSNRLSTGITQSEKDWGYAKRALSRGESPAAVIAAIAAYRRYDKPNPQYYAELTVHKAEKSLRAENTHTEEPERT
jgi:hypothetical protein